MPPSGTVSAPSGPGRHRLPPLGEDAWSQGCPVRRGRPWGSQRAPGQPSGRQATHPHGARAHRGRLADPRPSMGSLLRRGRARRRGPTVVVVTRRVRAQAADLPTPSPPPHGMGESADVDRGGTEPVSGHPEDAGRNSSRRERARQRNPEYALWFLSLTSHRGVPFSRTTPASTPPERGAMAVRSR